MKWLLAIPLLVATLVSHAEPQHCLAAARTVAVFALAVQEHVEPPKGWTCVNGSKAPADHACACHRTCAWNPETKQVEEHEDAKCRSYCFRDHCACLSECDSH